MKKIIRKENFSEIEMFYDVFFFDLYGITHNGVKLFPDIISILKRIKSLKKEVVFHQGMIGISINDFIKNYKIENPNHIKIDVDGNELDVINGCKKTIQKVEKVCILVETRAETHNYFETKIKNLGLKKINQFAGNSIWEK